MKTVILNGKKTDYDGRIDYNILDKSVDIYDDSAQSEILDRVKGCDIVVTKELVVDRDMIMKFPDEVKLILEAGTGYNNIDVKAARERGITVCNIPSYSTKRVAHTAIMFILNLSSMMQVQIRMLERKDHRNFSEYLMVEHTEVNGKTLGIIGAGTIGKEVIKIAKALDMNVLVYTRTPRNDEDGVRYVSLEDVLKQSDYVSLHCPLNDSTHHIINKDTLSMMKKSAFLINTARGPLVDEAALIDALKQNKIAGAALDVQEVEPLSDESPLFDMDNVIVTPHMGWKGLETRGRLLSMMKENIDAFRSGFPINVVN